MQNFKGRIERSMVTPRLESIEQGSGSVLASEPLIHTVH